MKKGLILPLILFLITVGCFTATMILAFTKYDGQFIDRVYFWLAVASLLIGIPFFILEVRRVLKSAE